MVEKDFLPYETSPENIMPQVDDGLP
ncbi:MAG: hypothetical protein ACD_75C01247G0003, partial [uncultured bacterium]